MKKNIATALAVCFLGVGLGACSINLAALYQQALAVVGVVQASLTPAKAFIDSGCSFLYREELRVNASPTCQQKVSAIRRGVEAICKNSALLTDDVVGNYIDKIQGAVFKAEKSGC